MGQDAGIDMGAIFDAAPTAQVVMSPGLHIVAANRAYCAVSGRSVEDLVGLHAFEVFPANPDDPEADIEAALQASVSKAIETGETDEMPVQQHDIQDQEGRYAVHYWRLVNTPIFADESVPDQPSHVLVSVEDLTRTILGNRLAEAKRRASMLGADVTYFEFDPQAETLVRTPQLDAMFGFGPDETGDSIQPFFDRIHPDDLVATQAEIERVSRTVGADLHHDYRAEWPDGTVRWLIGRGESLRDPETQSVRIVGVLLDVTEIRENEARLREAVETRDMLIAEVNHRVKNSLQMVMSILNMEAQQTRDDSARATLRAATARVQAVAAIHASLYEDGDVRSVQIDRYLERLADHLRTSLGAVEKNVEIALKIDPLRLPTDKAITLSLAVNELVTNSFKHGFHGTGEGTVTVELRRNGRDAIQLEVTDFGTGDSVHQLSDTASSGLGKRLITGMVAQLNGTIEETHKDGWRTCITFPE
ncbi:sensor histidine kinase [Roseivivax marinus]|uniref:sensor histidine kinase n=1 Tax=Roseivivax marinus TaxID=1379903 RepID=UPI00273F150F|nr:histidine kinase dimerization/phosphoacceptor domain -containing protein [Roseivivax marinus]